MTKTEQNRVLAWRLKLLRKASIAPRSVAQTCRRFGLSRQAFYKWRARHRAYGEAGLCDRPRAAASVSPRATPREVSHQDSVFAAALSLWAGQDRAYLKRFHQLERRRSSVHRILIRHGMNRSAGQSEAPARGRAGSATRSPSPGTDCRWM